MNQDRLVEIVTYVATVVTIVLGLLMTAAAIYATFFSN